jgi:hypothetical protein
MKYLSQASRFQRWGPAVNEAGLLTTLLLLVNVSAAEETLRALRSGCCWGIFGLERERERSTGKYGNNLRESSMAILAKRKQDNR